MPRKVVLVGFGEIARNQHAPVLISRSSSFELCAIVDPPLTKERKHIESPAPIFASLQDAMAQTQQHQIDTAIIACPPQYAQEYAQEALNDYNLSVFMEKPPGFDCRRLEELERIARSKKLTLYTGYHSTACPQIENAKAWVQSNMPLLKSIHIEWKESVSKWHPGQSWIVDGIFGVLDILFNPLSMLDEILASGSRISMQEYKLDKTRSKLDVPENWNGPISGASFLSVSKRPTGTRNCNDDKVATRDGDSRATHGDVIAIAAEFAWDHEEDDVWRMTFELTDGRRMQLYDGGAKMLTVMKDGATTTQHVGTSTDDTDDILRPEYEHLYDRFVDLLEAIQCEVRFGPLQITMDILQNSKRNPPEDFSMHLLT